MKEKLQILKDLVSQLGFESTGTLRAKIQNAISDVESQYKRDLDLISNAFLDDLEKSLLKR